MTDKRLVVAGASAGIGLEAARAALDEGARVVVIGRDAQRLERARDDLLSGRPGDARKRLAIVRADLTRENEVARALEEAAGPWGGIDALIDAVGKGHRATLRDLTPAAWEENWRVNILSAAMLARATVPYLAANGGGPMVFLGAASGKQPTAGQLASNVHKAGLLAFVTTLAAELAADGIRVNLVCPGRAMSPRRMEKAREVVRERGITVEAYFTELASNIPLGRLGEPEEVAALAVFLCSRQANYITGQSICVDGGMVRSIV